MLDAPSLLAGQLAVLRETRNGRGTSHAVLDRVLARLADATTGPLPATAALLGSVAPDAA